MTEKPDFITFPASHYTYVEKLGSFDQTARACWEELIGKKAEIAQNNQIVGAFAMYKMNPPQYRAGFALADKAKDLPSGLNYTHFEGGPYIRFTVTGSYDQMPEACGKAMDIVHKEKLDVSDNFFLENYLNDPTTTKEDELKTEILVPTVKSAVNAK